MTVTKIYQRNRQTLIYRHAPIVWGWCVTALFKTKEEGRRKKEEGWNWNGDLNPNPIFSPYDGGEFNPYLDGKLFDYAR
ncbi:MAG: hypothetical protein WBA41_17540 [Rivularia sp. (in: cyanobacteria)]